MASGKWIFILDAITNASGIWVYILDTLLMASRMWGSFRRFRYVLRVPDNVYNTRYYNIFY